MIRRRVSELPIDLPVIVDEAMAAMNVVLIELVRAMPELITHITRLRSIFIEASGMPLLLRLKPPLAGSTVNGLNIEMASLHDLQFLIQKCAYS